MYRNDWSGKKVIRENQKTNKHDLRILSLNQQLWGGGNQLGFPFRKNMIFLVVTNPKGAFIQACLGVAHGTDLGNGGEVVAWPEM